MDHEPAPHCHQHGESSPQEARPTDAPTGPLTADAPKVVEIGVAIAAGARYPLLGWLLSPMFASAAMSLSSVSVIGNALRLRALEL